MYQQYQPAYDQEAPSYYEKPNMDYNPRLGFVRKVYGILSVQLLLTGLGIYLAGWHFANFFLTPTAHFIAIFCAVIAIIISFTICCYTSCARSVPTNYYLLFTFTLCEAFLVSMTTSFYTKESVLLVAALTISLTLALTLYAMTTKRDFTTWGAILFVLGWGLLAFGIVFFWTMGRGGISKNVYYVWNILGVLLYGFYLIYDTQLIMGGGKYSLTLDDYVLGALIIYIDIIVLFLKLLRLFGNRR